MQTVAAVTSGYTSAVLALPSLRIIVHAVLGDRTKPETCYAHGHTVGDADALVRSCGRPLRSGTEVTISFENLRAGGRTLVDLEAAGHIASGTILTLIEVELVEDDEVVARGFIEQ